MTQVKNIKQRTYKDNDLDQWIKAAAESAGYEEGFGIPGCDLSQSNWWAAYLRQSTEEQRSNNRAVEYLRTCAQEAKKLGVVVPREYVLYDVVSGEHLERPGIIYLRKDLAPGRRIAGILFPTVDRLSREPIHIAIFEYEMEHCRVQCHYTDAPTGSDQMSQMFRQLSAHMAKNVKLANRKNNRAGNVGRALKGIAPAFRPSYGYNYRAEYREESGRRSVVKAWWEVDSLGPDGNPESRSPAWVVQQVFAWLGAEEKSLHWVAGELNRLGIPSAQDRRWNPGKVQRLMRNRCYTGKHAYNVNARVPSLNQPLGDITAEIKRNRKEPKPESEWVYFDVPKLVSEALWEQANKTVSERGRGRGKRGKSIQALLRGRIHCPRCRHPMIVRRYTRDKERKYYLCGRRGQQWREDPCSYRKFVPSTWDQVVWAGLCSLLRDDSWLDAEVAEAQQEDKAAQGLIAHQERKIAQAKIRRSKVQEGFEGDIYTLDQAKVRIARLDEDMVEAQQEIEQLRTRAGRPPRSSAEMSALREKFRQLRDRNLDEATFEERADIIARLRVRVWPAEDLKTMHVKCRLPVEDRPTVGDLPRLSPNFSDTGVARLGNEPEPECEKVPPAPPKGTRTHEMTHRIEIGTVDTNPSEIRWIITDISCGSVRRTRRGTRPARLK